MNEAAAREVLFVRAVENAAAADKLLAPGDRAYAGRAAAELVRWQAAEKGDKATEEAFVAKRAELLAARLFERSPATARAFRSLRWRSGIGVAVPMLALAAGALMEHLADRRHVSILAFPLLGIVAWNFIVYLLLLVRAPLAARDRERLGPGWLGNLAAGVRTGVVWRAAGTHAAALGAFGADWLRRAAPLAGARAGKVLHVSAALFALGAVAGMYVRGFAFEYRAGWESTFLDAEAVHAIVSVILQPAAWLLGQSLPGVDQIARLRWADGATGENAARWIHLYAVTVLASVVLPRLLLAGHAARRERALATHFPVAFDEPYFRRVLSAWRDSPAHVRVVAYAYTPAQEACEGLEKVAAHLLGEDVRVHFTRPVAYGEEDDFAAAGADPSPPDLVIALFNLGSTPETENHGVFLDAVASRATGADAVAMIVDESTYRRQLGAQAGARARLAERRQAWTGFAGARDLHPVFADLSAPDLAAAGRELDMQRATAKATA